MVGAGVCGRVAVAGRVVAAGLWPMGGWAWVVRGADDAAGAGRGDAAGVWPIGGKAWVVDLAGAWAGIWAGAWLGVAVEAAGGVAEGGALFRSRVRLEPGRCGGGVVACPEITRAAARAIMGMADHRAAGARPQARPHALGSATQKVAPSPGAEITPIEPPCNSTNRLARAKPTPCPSTVERSRPRRLKGSNSCACF